MGLHTEYEENDFFPDYPEEDANTLMKRRKVRKQLEARLEKKRIRQELDDFEEDFDWSDYDK